MRLPAPSLVPGHDSHTWLWQGRGPVATALAMAAGHQGNCGPCGWAAGALVPLIHGTGAQACLPDSAWRQHLPVPALSAIYAATRKELD